MDDPALTNMGRIFGYFGATEWGQPVPHYGAYAMPGNYWDFRCMGSSFITAAEDTI